MTNSNLPETGGTEADELMLQMLNRNLEGGLITHDEYRGYRHLMGEEQLKFVDLGDGEYTYISKADVVSLIEEHKISAETKVKLHPAQPEGGSIFSLGDLKKRFEDIPTTDDDGNSYVFSAAKRIPLFKTGFKVNASWKTESLDGAHLEEVIEPHELSDEDEHEIELNHGNFPDANEDILALIQNDLAMGKITMEQALEFATQANEGKILLVQRESGELDYFSEEKWGSELGESTNPGENIIVISLTEDGEDQTLTLQDLNSNFEELKTDELIDDGEKDEAVVKADQPQVNDEKKEEKTDDTQIPTGGVPTQPVNTTPHVPTTGTGDADIPTTGNNLPPAGFEMPEAGIEITEELKLTVPEENEDVPKTGKVGAQMTPLEKQEVIVENLPEDIDVPTNTMAPELIHTRAGHKETPKATPTGSTGTTKGRKSDRKKKRAERQQRRVAAQQKQQQEQQQQQESAQKQNQLNRTNAQQLAGGGGGGGGGMKKFKKKALRWSLIGSSGAVAGTTAIPTLFGAAADASAFIEPMLEVSKIFIA